MLSKGFQNCFIMNLPSRCHIKGSKTAKGLQSAKVLVNWGPFDDFFLGKKFHNAEKLKGGPFEIFQHPFCRKSPKKLKGDPLRIFFFKENAPQCRKNSKVGDLSLARYCMLRGKKGKTFLVQFPGPTGTY